MNLIRLLRRLSAAVLLAALLLSALTGCDILGESRETEDSAPIETTDGTQETTGTDTTAESTSGASDPGDEPPEVYISRPELTVTCEPAFFETVETALEEYEVLIKREEATDAEAIEAYRALEDLFYELRLNANLAYIESCLYKTDETRAEVLLELQSFYNASVQSFLSLHRTIADSRYGDAVFADWTEEELREVLETADTYDEECAALQTELDELHKAWRELSEAEFTARSEEIYREVVRVGSALADKLGYAGYMEYAYDASYDREYTPTEAKALQEYAAELLVPIMENAIGRLSAIKLSNEEIMTLRDILFGSFESREGRALLDGYYEWLGGDIYDAYLDFWENGYYYVGYDEECSEARAFTAYLDVVDRPAIYFGPGYREVFTFVHEFGHYYNYYKNGDTGDLSYDLAEAQSQGDEWLFLAYLTGEVYAGTNVATYLECYRVANDLLSLTVSLTVNEFERTVCLDGGKAAIDSDLDQLYREAADAVWSYADMGALLGYAPETYWRYVVIEQSGYYVSYAVSMIPAIELYVTALDDLSSAVEAYEALQTTGGFLEALDGAELGSPFEEEVYGRIAEAFR